MNFLLVLLIYFNFFIYRFFDASVDIFTLAIQGYLLLCPLLIVYFVLQPSVDIKTVLSRLMERLSNYAASSAEVLPEFLQVEAFSKLNNAIGKVRLKNGDIEILIILAPFLFSVLWRRHLMTSDVKTNFYY